jgi:hypothetical protein
MQRGIGISFEHTPPSAREVAARSETLSGINVEAQVEPFEFGQVYTLRFGDVGEVEVQFTNHDRRAIIEFDEPPTYLDWVVTAALQDLGGIPSQWPPPFARKRFEDVTWFERLQLRRRFFPRWSETRNRRAGTA